MKEKIEIIFKGIADESISPQDGINQLRVLRDSVKMEVFKEAYKSIYGTLPRGDFNKVIGLLKPLLIN